MLGEHSRFQKPIGSSVSFVALHAPKACPCLHGHIQTILLYVLLKLHLGFRHGSVSQGACGKA